MEMHKKNNMSDYIFAASVGLVSVMNSPISSNMPYSTTSIQETGSSYITIVSDHDINQELSLQLQKVYAELMDKQKDLPEDIALLFKENRSKLYQPFEL